MLVGREPELARLDALLAGARGGTSGVLVLRGEPGIGKTALLAHAAERATGMRVLAGRGFESEVHVPFAGLLEVLRPALGLVDRLPARQADALRGALGLGPAAAGDRALIGAATLSLLGAQAEESPALVLVDDLNWVDGASAAAIVFAARRLLADAVAVVLAVRAGEPSAADGSGLPEQELTGLDPDASRRLLALAAEAPVGPAVADRLVQECAGNPLGLEELAREAGDLRVDLVHSPLPVGARIVRALGRRLEELSAPGRVAVLVAAADRIEEIDPLVRAAEKIGGSLAGLEAAEAAGLIELGAGRVAFRHPLVRSVAYSEASAADRRAAHRALAAALDDPDRRAWHVAAATVTADEEVAGGLAAAAGRARERSAYAAAASAFERAARLTPAGGPAGARLVAAADAAWLAGDAARALALLDDADAPAADIAHLRGRVLARCGPVPEAVAALRTGAEAVAADDPARAGEMLAEASYAAAYAGDHAAMSACAERALALAADARSRGLAHIATGVARVLAGGGDPAEPLRAAAAIAEAEPELRDDPRLVAWLGIAPLFLRDRRAEYGPLRDAVAEARAHGTAGGLPFALFHVGTEAFAAGRWPEAAAAWGEGAQLARETGARVDLATVLGGMARLDARRGRAEPARAYAVETRDLTRALGLPLFESWAHAALADLAWGEGDVPGAIAALEDKAAVLAAADLRDPDVSPAPELVEAYLRVGRDADARAEAAAHEQAARVKGLPWAQARAARARALATGDEAAFRAALDAHAEAPDPFELARTQLCFGEWLRRSARRADARPVLRAAQEGFERLGAAPWAERARTELRATGETVRRRDPATLDELTPQELRVAMLLAEGATTREAAAALFLSPKTIEYHLRNAYIKLGVNSRVALANALIASRR